MTIMKSKSMSRIHILLLIVALAMSIFPASIVAENSPTPSGDYTLHLSDASGTIISGEVIESFRFQVSGLDDSIYHYAFTEFEIRRDGQAFAIANAPSLSPTIRLGDPSMYASASNPKPVYAVYYRIHYIVLGESTGMETEWNQAQVNVDGNAVPFYFVPAEKQVLSVDSVELIAAKDVANGTAKEDIGLPSEVNITLSNNSTQRVAVQWDHATPTYDPDVSGSYEFTGELQLPAEITNPNNLKVSIIVRVLEQEEAELTVESVAAIADINVSHGTDRLALPLPSEVKVILSNQTSRNLGVTWDNGIPVYNGNLTGEYTFIGTLSQEVDNPQNLTAQVKVVVKAKPTEPDTEAPTWPNGSVLTVSDITQTSVKLSWPSAIDKKGVIGYRIYVDSREYQTVMSSVYEQTVTGLKAGATYTFTLKALNVAGEESVPLSTKATTTQSSSGGGSGGSPTPPAPKKPKEPVLDPGEMNPPSAESSVTFTDIKGHWAESYIKQASTKGIVGGYPDGTFKPNHRVTRAEFTVMLVNALKLEGATKLSTFSDDKHIGAWAKQEVDRAVQAGIITGYGDGSFRPSASITRAEMAVMFARAMDLPFDTHAVSPFADDKAIPSWAKGAVDAVHRIGIVNGRGENRFVPNGTATRAEATAMLVRMLEREENQ